MTSSNSGGGDGLGAKDKLAAFDSAIIKKAMERLDEDLKAHVYLSGLSLNVDKVIKTLSVVSILQNDRFLSGHEKLNEAEILGIKTTNTLLATGLSKSSKQKDSN